MDSLQALLDPRSVAVVGASPRGNRGLQIIENLQRFGSTARIYPVHPRAETVAGLRAYPSIAALPEVCEFVAIALEAGPALDVLEEAIDSGARAGLLIGSGFGEGGNGGEHGRRLRRLLEGTDFRLCGPNCYGIVNGTTGFAAYSGSVVDPFLAGRVALVMQSGALTHTVTDSSMGRGLGLSHLITTGNEVSVTMGHYVRALARTDGVDVIGVFLEGIRDADDFADAAIEAAASGKPVVALTVGHSTAGQSAAMAHTGALAGGGPALSGYLRRYGVVEAGDVDEFRELLLLFSSERPPTRPRVAVASISGGGSGLLADGAERAGVELATLAEDTVDRLAQVLPDFATVANPLDLTGAAVENPSVASGALAALQADPGVGTLVLALNVLKASPGQETLYRDQARILAKQAQEDGCPVLAMSLASGGVDEEVVRILSEHGVPLLAGTTASLRAIAGYLDWHLHPAPDPRRRPTGTDRFDGLRDVVGGKPALDLVRGAGIAVPRTQLCPDADAAAERAAAAAGPVVLKVEAAGLAHKTEVGGVLTGLHGPDEVREAAHAMQARVARHLPDLVVDGFLVQEQVTEPGVECIVGALRDPQVGWVLTVAPGGVLTELGGPAQTVPLPVTGTDLDRLLDDGPLGRLLAGYRGAPDRDRASLKELVTSFGDLVASAAPALREAELNPVLVRSDGLGAIALDALFVLEES